MKSYDETIRTVFDRIDAYETGLEKRRKILGKAAVSLGCICLIALLGFLLIPSNEDPLPPGSLQVPTFGPPPEKVDLDILYWENTVVVNPIEGISSDRYYIALMVDDFIPMTDTELNAYFGINIFPQVPQDLGAEWSDKENIPHGIYKRNGGTGEVYHDWQVLNWSNEDFTRTVNIELRKGGLPLICYTIFDTDYEKSMIKNVPVSIGQTEAGLYLVEFIYKDVGFRMIIEGLSQDEIVAIIESLIS